MPNTATSSTTGGKKVASLQAPFDPRIRTLAMPMQNINRRPINRGYMMQQDPLPGYVHGRKGKFFFKFLYNPATIEAMYTVQSSGAALSYLFPNPGDAGNLAVPITQTVSWTVMFDRTYELNMGSYDDSGNLVSGSKAVPTPSGISADPTVYGVWADVIQMQFFTGMMLTGQQAQGNNFLQGNTPTTGSGQSHTFNFKANQGFMMMVPCWVFFGGQQNINYFGYISEWDVTYTHFTQWMVPMRCVIDISFQMLPPPPSKGRPTGAGYYAPNPVTFPIKGPHP